jgi:hypothetical protein
VPGAGKKGRILRNAGERGEIERALAARAIGSCMQNGLSGSAHGARVRGIGRGNQ